MTAPSLSPRGKVVLQLVADGLTQTEIAGQLTIERTTVAEHMARVRVALDAANTPAAVAAAMRLGLIE